MVLEYIVPVSLVCICWLLQLCTHLVGQRGGWRSGIGDGELSIFGTSIQFIPVRFYKRFICKIFLRFYPSSCLNRLIVSVQDHRQCRRLRLDRAAEVLGLTRPYPLATTIHPLVQMVHRQVSFQQFSYKTQI